MDRKESATSEGRNADGTFAAGNPGRPKGVRTRYTRAAEALLGGEAEALTRKAIDMALEGDTTALRLCLERITPPRKDTPVQFALPPMKKAEDAAEAAGAILGAVGAGELTPIEGAHIMGLVDTFRRALELSEIETRITALEANR